MPVLPHLLGDRRQRRERRVEARHEVLPDPQGVQPAQSCAVASFDMARTTGPNSDS